MPHSRSTSSVLLVVAGTVLFLSVVAAYVPALSAGFIWDDSTGLQDNPLIYASDGLLRLWTQPAETPQGFYWPMTWSSFWLEYQLWDFNPMGYHAVNIVLHALNALLIWFLLVRLRVPGAWVGAMLFALHPVNVESVAWITERKNTLSLLVGLLCVLSYVRFNENRRAGTYALALLLFVLALLSKSSMAVIPALLVVLHFWKEGSLKLRHVVQTGPMFVCAGIAAFFQTTLLLDKANIQAELSLIERAVIVSKCIWFSLGNLVYPDKLIAIYAPFDMSRAEQILMPTLCLGLLALLFFTRNRIGRGAFTAFACYMICFSPHVASLVDPYFASFAHITDHAAYVPSIAVLALAGAGLGIAFQRGGGMRGMAIALLLVLLPTYGALTWSQAKLYESEEILFRHTLDYNPDAWPAHVNVGNEHLARLEFDKATFHFEEAIRIHPQSALAHAGLGSVLATQGRFDEALPHFESATAINENHVTVIKNYALALMDSHRMETAEDVLDHAVRIRPNDADIQFLLGLLRMKQQSWPEAYEAFYKATELKPIHAGAHHNAGAILYASEQWPEALAMYDRVIELEPNNTVAYLDRVQVLIDMGRRDEAVQALEEAGPLVRDLGQRARYKQLKQALAGSKTAP